MANPIKAVKAVKNVVKNFPGGKKGRAIEKKVRKEFGMEKGGMTAGKAKSIAREKKYGTASYKVAKQNDSFVNQYAKYAKKSGSNLKGNQALAGAVAPKSVSKKVGPKVPVKRRSK